MPEDKEFEELLPTEIELTFEKSSLYKLYRSGWSQQINPERWDRVRRDIRFEDVVADLTGHSGTTSIRCPFHGRDSRPSFWLYKRTNDGWCFGCPPKEQYYDHVRFVSKYLGISRSAALRWLEKKWELPELADIKPDEEEVDSIELQFADLQEPFILKAIKQVQEFRDVELAEDYLCHYFKATQCMKFSEDAKKEGEPEDAAALEVKATLTLARALTKEERDRIFAYKQVRR
jgi:hypothetical protein